MSFGNKEVKSGGVVPLNKKENLTKEIWKLWKW
jgi:hypothetical protein